MVNKMVKPKRLTKTIPPLKGPCPQGLNIQSKKVKIINPEKNNNGNDR